MPRVYKSKLKIRDFVFSIYNDYKCIEWKYSGKTYFKLNETGFYCNPKCTINDNVCCYTSRNINWKPITKLHCTLPLYINNYILCSTFY